MTISYLSDFLFIVRFRIGKMITGYIPMKTEGIIYGKHIVRVIEHKGRFLLLECKNCGDRELATDKIEAMGIYSKKECIR